MLSQSDIPEHRMIAESAIITKFIDQFDAMTRNEFLSQGTHAQMAAYMEPYIHRLVTEVDNDQDETENKMRKGKFKYNHGRGYYRGERVVLAGDTSLGGYLTHKMWHLNEVKPNKDEKMLHCSNIPYILSFLL